MPYRFVQYVLNPVFAFNHAPVILEATALPVNAVPHGYKVFDSYLLLLIAHVFYFIPVKDVYHLLIFSNKAFIY